jgi:hypothetical protein
MQSILQSALARFATYKFLNDLQFVFTAGFESAGIVENITVVVSEDEFVLDVMHATLQAESSRSAATNGNLISLPDLYRGVELNLSI